MSNVQRFGVQVRRQRGSLLQQTRAYSPFVSMWGPMARQVASLFVQRAEQYTDERVAYLARLAQGDEVMHTTYRLTQAFLRMVRERPDDVLDQ